MSSCIGAYFIGEMTPMKYLQIENLNSFPQKAKINFHVNFFGNYRGKCVEEISELISENIHFNS